MVNVTTAASLLECPTWNSLNGGHASIALGGQLARRYPKAMAVFAGVAENTPAAFAELAETTPTGEVVVIFGGDEPAESPYWQLSRKTEIVLLVCEKPIAESSWTGSTDAPVIEVMTAADVPDMLALVKLTEPGPFFERTVELGHYYGMRQAGQLAAMAGERLYLNGYREISAVCTHPDFQRRGYSKRLVTRLVNEIFEAGLTPFLHTGTNNSNAIALYKSLGFTMRPPVALYVLKRTE